MHITNRSYLTAGVAALGAGAIALTPIQPLPNHIAAGQEKAVSTLAVSLAATIDPITPWVDTFKLSAANIKSLAGFYLEKPFPLLQTVVANLGTYAAELAAGQGNVIPGQISGNINTFFYAPWSPGQCTKTPCGDPALYNGDFISNVPITNKVPGLFKDGASQRQLYELLPALLTPEQETMLAPVLAFAANHYSGQVAGIVGPLLAPLIQLTRSFTAVGAYFQAGDVLGAINEIINIPANVTNAVLNGAGYLDLTSVASGLLPASVKSIGLNLGGLISPPVPYEGTLATPTALNGGTLFDNIAVSAQIAPLPAVTSPGLPVSWFGSVIGLGQFLGKAMLVTNTPKTAATASVAPAASTPAVVAEAPAPVEAAPAVADAPAAVQAPAPAVADDPAPVEAAEVEAPAPQAVSAPSPAKQAAASDNDGNSGSSRGGHKGARGNHAN